MDEYQKLAHSEQKILKQSIIMTLFLALIATLIGIISSASAILFDGIYAAIDSIFSIAGLLIAKLIALDAQDRLLYKPALLRRFHHGFWHLEPLLLLINSACLTGAVLYALFDALRNLLAGGSQAHFVPALVFAFFAMLLCFFMGFYERYSNKELQSSFIALDEKSWLISAFINAGLLLAFAFGLIIENSLLARFAPYIDPLAVLVIAIFVLPMPIKILRQALSDILLITPKEKHKQLKMILDELVAEYKFTKAYHYVSYMGRSLVVEIHIIVPKDYPLQSVSFFDEIREELSHKIGEAGPDRWFTVSFTGDEKWAL